MKKENRFDVIIVGGSYSGLAAAMALGRGLRNVLIIDAGDPCNKQTPQSHNFLTNDGKSPKEIATLARQQVSRYRTVHFLKAFATNAVKTEHGFEVETEPGEIYSSRKLILATGIKDLMPDIPGFRESWGISVLHCPYCHGYEVKHRKTGILANGDAGYELSALISNWTNELTLYTNGNSTLSTEQRIKLQKHAIDVEEAEIEKLEQENGHIENIVFKNGINAQVMALYAKLPFEQHCSIAQGLKCEFTQEGYVKVDGAQKTSLHGVFACGDNTTRMRTVANAVSMGTTAGMIVNKELIEEDF